MALFCLNASSTLTLFHLIFSIALFCIQNAEHPHLSFPQDSLPWSCCFLNFFFSTPLFTLCLCLFSITSAEKSPSKDKKQMGSNNIPLLLHCFARGSMPLLTERSNWHHSKPCGIWQGCYVARATIPNCLLGSWAYKIGFLLVCMKVTLAQWQWTQVTAIASEALKKKIDEAALYAKTCQSHIKPNLFCNYSHVR